MKRGPFRLASRVVADRLEESGDWATAAAWRRRRPNPEVDPDLCPGLGWISPEAEFSGRHGGAIAAGDGPAYYAGVFGPYGQLHVVKLCGDGEPTDDDGIDFLSLDDSLEGYGDGAVEFSAG